MFGFTATAARRVSSNYAALITSGGVQMKRECDNYPDLNHENCILDPYETAVVEHFESQGFTVDKLCTAWLPDGEVVPDFLSPMMKAGSVFVR
jgi:hypothetical protein